MDLEKLKGKRKVMKTSVTKLITKMETYVESIDFENKSNFDQLTEYLTNINDKQSELKLVNNQIQDLIDDGTVFENDVQTSIDYDDAINETKFKIKLNLKKFKIDSVQPDISSVFDASTIPYVTARPATINLPKITIPVFKEDPNTFLEFMNSFKSTIDSNENLTKIDRFIT